VDCFNLVWGCYPKILKIQVNRKFNRYCFVFVIVVQLVACASEIKREPTTLARDALASTVVQLDKSVEVLADAGGSRTLPAGSRWMLVGKIVEGTVYKPLDIVLTLSSRNVHEAYIVIADNLISGFYLPGELTFAAIKNKTAVSFQRVP
jgi:hypothetical protein